MNNPIIKDINNIKEQKRVDYINCVFVDDEYIIPGLNGKEINVDKSFHKMKKESTFNEELLEYNQLEPQESIKNNKNRIIIKGNSHKNSVSIVFEDNNNLAKYISKQGYKINLLINKESYSYEYELINNASKEELYKTIEKHLNKKGINSELCLYTNQNCSNKYLFKPSLIINRSNFPEMIKTITSGEIIQIENSLSLEQLNLLIKQIEYQSLSIVPLSKLISEIN